MAKKFLTAISMAAPIDLAKNELQNGVMHNLAAAPSSPSKFQVYGNTSDNTLYWWDGSQWIAAKAAAGAVPAGSVTTQAVGDTGVVGVSTNFAREDHKHGMPAFANPTATTTFGLAAVNGSAATLARSDHTHGTPTHDAAAHSGIPLNLYAAPTGVMNFNNQRLVGVATPTSGNEGANKDYVDNLVSGVAWKSPSARAATTANITLSAPQTIDGVSVIAGDRVLVKNQTNQTENGLYLVAAGAWTRTTDADSGPELLNAATWVSEGTLQSDTGWTCTANAPITVGSTNLPWAQFGGTGGSVPPTRTLTGTAPIAIGGVHTAQDLSADRVISILAASTTVVGAARLATTAEATAQSLATVAVTPAGLADRVLTSRTISTTAPLTGGGALTGNLTIAISAATESAVGAIEVATQAEVTTGTDDTRAITPLKLASALSTYANAAKRYAVDVGGATSQVITHNLNTLDCIVQVYRKASPFDVVECDIEHTSTTTATLRFTTAPAAAEYRAVVLA